MAYIITGISACGKSTLVQAQKHPFNAGGIRLVDGDDLTHVLLGWPNKLPYTDEFYDAQWNLFSQLDDSFCVLTATYPGDEHPIQPDAVVLPSIQQLMAYNEAKPQPQRSFKDEAELRAVASKYQSMAAKRKLPTFKTLLEAVVNCTSPLGVLRHELRADPKGSAAERPSHV